MQINVLFIVLDYNSQFLIWVLILRCVLKGKLIILLMLPLSSLVSLYETCVTWLILNLVRYLVRCKLDYYIVIWNPIFSSDVGLLESIQIKFLRFLYLTIMGYYPSFSITYEIILKLFSFCVVTLCRQITSFNYLDKLFLA